MVKARHSRRLFSPAECNRNLPYCSKKGNRQDAKVRQGRRQLNHNGTTDTTTRQMSKMSKSMELTFLSFVVSAVPSW
jgi:hypothetical protein